MSARAEALALLLLLRGAKPSTQGVPGAEHSTERNGPSVYPRGAWVKVKVKSKFLKSCPAVVQPSSLLPWNSVSSRRTGNKPKRVKSIGL